MYRLLLVFALALPLSGCNKIEKTEKTITGVWTIVKYKFTEDTGIVYYFPCTGTMSFGSCGDKVCVYDLRADYTSGSGNPYQKYNDGHIELTGENDFVLHRNNPDGSVTTLTYGHIALMTKDDLQLEFHDSIGLHEFVLQK